MLQKRYIKRLDMEIAPLGAGVMRFQTDDGSFSDDAFRLTEIAMSEGINYYDTGYLYNSGRSEEFIRKAFVEKYPRESFYIADKLPVWLCKNRDDMERIFNIQLERLGVEYIDVYLLHALHKATWTYVYEQGVLDFLEAKLKEGRIRKTGFSFHDTADNLPMIADAYDWHMAQLQINYYDWIIQDVRKSYEYLTSKDIPVVVMEPVGGGRLVNLPPAAAKKLREVNPKASIPSWAIRFCASLENVAVVLSGMRTEAELQDNLSCFKNLRLLTKEEYAALEDAVDIFKSSGAIVCSACRYCTDGCPAGIDIPHIFQQYNDYVIFNRPISLTWAYMDIVPVERQGDKCIKCGQCQKICPQKIDVPAQLDMVHSRAVLMTVFKNNECYEKCIENIGTCDIVLFGAGAFGKSVFSYIKSLNIGIRAVCDNSKELWGTDFGGVPIISPQELALMHKKGNLKVIIANKYHHDAIKNQLVDIGITPVNQ